jgi:glycosyltransferase involved in cell wall biosynthesis
VRVLHISKYDLKGGASRAAYNSVVSQRSAGIEAELLVGLKGSDSSFVHSPSGVGHMSTLFRYAGDKAPSLLFGKEEVRSLHYFGIGARTIERKFRPDLIVLHKVDGIVAIRDLVRFGVPVVWRIHDMWSICGMRHYQPDNEILGNGIPRWTGGLLQRAIDNVLYQHKRKVYRQANCLTFCPPSQWLANCLRESSIFDRQPYIHVVPNGIDTEKFRPVDSKRTRRELNLPIDAKIVLFGASHGTREKRKGFDLLSGVLRSLIARKTGNTMLLVFGDKLPNEVSGLDINAKSVGTIADDRVLAKVYSVADVFVSPSRQENLSLTVLESLSCGTPVAAFDIGGMPDMISDEHNGWLARPFDVSDLADKLSKAISLPGELRHKYRTAARETVTSRFSLEAEAVEMQELYQIILDRRAHSVSKDKAGQ